MQPATDADRSAEVRAAVELYREYGLVPFPVCKPQGAKHCAQHGTCSSPGKRPLIARWTEADASERITKRLDAIFESYGWDTNIGLLCGAEHGLVVLDVDGSEGSAALAAVGYDIPPTTTVRTGRVGGFHHWYKPGEAASYPKKLGFLPHCDFVGDGGYVLAPPSVHRSGNVYTFCGEPLDEDAFSELPPSLTELVTAHARPSNLVMLPLGEDDQVQVGQRTLRFLSEGSPVGQQREDMVHAISNLVGRGMDPDEIVRRVSHALIDLSPCGNASDPWTEEDVVKVVREFMRKPRPAAALPEEPILAVEDEPKVEPDPHGTKAQRDAVVRDNKTRVRDIFEALEDVAWEDPIMEGLIYPRACQVVFATSGTGKTLWTLEIMLHLAAGREYHGRQCRQSKVMLVEIDDTYQLRNYMETMRDTYGFTREELNGNFITNREDDSDFSLKTERDRVALQAFVAEHSPNVVVLDHLEGFLPGEGYSASVYRQFRLFKDWCKARDITLWCIDHSLKHWMPNTDEGQPKNHLEALAGGQQKLAIFDVAFHMYGSLEQGPVTIWYAKLRDKKPDPLVWSFGSEGSTVKAQLPSGNVWAGLSPKEVKVAEFVSNSGPVETQAILDRCGISRAGLHRLLQAVLLPRGLVARVGTGGGKGKQTMYAAGPLYLGQDPKLTV